MRGFMIEDKKYNILFVSAECIPFCANGGVADMCYALPKYLNKTGKVDIRVVLPLYSKIPEAYRKDFRLVGERKLLNFLGEKNIAVYLSMNLME